MTCRTDVVDLLMPGCIAKYPTSFGNPEVADLAADNGIPVLVVSGSIGKTMIAKT
jgi:hypothetical protein